MNNIKIKLASLLLLLLVAPAYGQWGDVHEDDWDPDTPLWLINEVINTHDGKCTNRTDDFVATKKIRCHDWSKGSPRDWSTGCDADSCEARATIYCPGVPYTCGGDWCQFRCDVPLTSTGEGVPIEAGVLGHDPQGRPIKGVQCLKPNGQTFSCGCIVTGSGTSQGFGNMVPMGTGFIYCQP